jgi:hypothetical protein
MQQGRQIGQCLFAFAADNTAGNNAYPDGSSSTEVFQKLIDGGYVTDPKIFFVPMPGKVAPEPGQKKLKPENVSWDVTVPVNLSSSDLVPLVFLTGYKVNYVPGGSAVPLKPHPQIGHLRPPTWWEKWFGQPPFYTYEPATGAAIFYNGNNAVYLPSLFDPDGIIHNFVPPDFKPDGHVYRQLTPDGVMP